MIIFLSFLKKDIFFLKLVKFFFVQKVMKNTTYINFKYLKL